MRRGNDAIKRNPKEDQNKRNTGFEEQNIRGVDMVIRLMKPGKGFLGVISAEVGVAC